MHITTFSFPRPELYRKSIHAASILIPLVCYCFGFVWTEIFLILATVLILLFEYLRLGKNEKLTALLQKLEFDSILRPNEVNGFTSGTILVLTALVMLYLMPPQCYVVAFSTLVISDTCASYFGMKYGLTKIADKSLEGSVAFLISSTIIAFFWYWLLDETHAYLFSMLICGAVATLAELFARKISIDDNALIPVAYYVSYSITYGMILDASYRFTPW